MVCLVYMSCPNLAFVLSVISACVMYGMMLVECACTADLTHAYCDELLLLVCSQQ